MLKKYKLVTTTLLYIQETMEGNMLLSINLVANGLEFWLEVTVVILMINNVYNVEVGFSIKILLANYVILKSVQPVKIRQINA